MNNEEKAIIWDFDGTLIDSYGIIVDSLNKTLQEKNIKYSCSDIQKFVKINSVYEFLKQISFQYGFDFLELKNRYSTICKDEQMNLNLIPNAKETLKLLTKRGVRNFIYTHKGLSTFEIVKEKKIVDYFEEIITSNSNFERKPNPEALFYFINKYCLEKSSTFYIGDRVIDVECACNAGIRSILLDFDNKLSQYNVKPDYVITDLLEIENIIFVK